MGVSIETSPAAYKTLSVWATFFHTPDPITYFSVLSTLPHRERALLVLIQAVLRISIFVNDAPVQIDRFIQLNVDDYLAIRQSNFDESLLDVVGGRVSSFFAGMQRRVIGVVQRAAFREIRHFDESPFDDFSPADFENGKLRGEVRTFTVDAFPQKISSLRRDPETFTCVFRTTVYVVCFLYVLACFATLVVGIRG